MENWRNWETRELGNYRNGKGKGGTEKMLETGEMKDDETGNWVKESLKNLETGKLEETRTGVTAGSWNCIKRGTGVTGGRLGLVDYKTGKLAVVLNWEKKLGCWED